VLVPGHFTSSPGLQGVGLGGGLGGLGGLGGVGDGLGGVGDGEVVQSMSFALVQPLKELSAEGQTEPSGQHSLPAQCVCEAPGHRTGSPTLHCGYGGEGGAGVGAGGDARSKQVS